jgi:hypothetical protein
MVVKSSKMLEAAARRQKAAAGSKHLGAGILGFREAGDGRDTTQHASITSREEG